MDGESQSLPEERARLERSSILADPRHRRILSILQSSSRPVTVDELCRRLATTGRDGADVATVDYQSIRLDLRHCRLPSLEAVGWIVRRPDGIRLDEPLFPDAIDFSPPPLWAPDDPAWPVVSALLARPSRLTILSIVARHDDSLDLADLAAELRATDDVTRVDGDRRLPVALHHVDLPKLASTGVIEYDPDARTVAPTPRLAACLDRLDIEIG